MASVSEGYSFYENMSPAVTFLFEFLRVLLCAGVIPSSISTSGNIDQSGHIPVVSSSISKAYVMTSVLDTLKSKAHSATILFSSVELLYVISFRW